MTTLNSQDELYRFNTQKPIADLHNKELAQKDFREIILGAKQEDTEQDLWLRLKDDDFTWNNLYLGRSKTFEKGKSPKKYNVVVPIIPRCYATPDRDPAKAVEVPEGWLYIIRQFDSPQGTAVELWRELKSDGLSNYSDVHVKKFKGKDQRKATGQAGFRIIVPYCIDKEVHQLWIAYSEVQWSWARIQRMKKDAKLRNMRMHYLDLKDCLNNFDKSNYTAPASSQKSDGQQSDREGTNGSDPTPASESQNLTNDRQGGTDTYYLDEVMVVADANTAELYNLKSAPDSVSKNLCSSLKEAIPVVYLDNPIGIGRKLAGEYQQQWQELNDCLTDLRRIPELITQPSLVAPESLNDDLQKRHGVERWIEAAALANRYFYSKISKEIPPGVKDPTAYQKRLTEIDKQFLGYQNKLDKPLIEEALRAPQRRTIRKKLVQAREDLVDFLKMELPSTNPIKEKEGAQDPPLVQALDDYFTLAPLGDQERKQNTTDRIGNNAMPQWRDNYLDGWGAVYDIVSALGKHEYSLDADLESNPPDGWGWRRNNPSFEFLRNLADPQGGNPLHSRLFPKAAADNPLAIDAAPIDDNGTNFKQQHLVNLDRLIRRDPDIVRGLALFGSNFSEMMAMRDKNNPTYEKSLERSQHSVLRLVESVFCLQLEPIQISLAELITKAKQEVAEEKNGGTSLFKAFYKCALFMQKSMDTAKDFPTTAKPGSRPLDRIGVQVITVINKTRTLQLLRELGDNKAVTSGLGGFLGLVKIHNFAKALEAYTGNKNHDRDWEVFAPLVSSFIKLPTAIKSVRGMMDAMAGVDTTGGVQTGSKNARSMHRTQAVKTTAGVEILEKLGRKVTFVASLIDFELTLSSFIENLAQGDDAAIADAIGLSGITIGIIATFIAIPGAGWIIGLTALAAFLAKAYLFTEDEPVDIWLNNGPFARGEESHAIYSYKRETAIRKVRDAQGHWVEKACIVHRYYNDSLYVDTAGNLVDVGRPLNHWANFPLFKGDQNGHVYLMAGKHPEAKQDTIIGTIGQPFTMHPLLQPTVRAKSESPWLYAVSPAAGLFSSVVKANKHSNFGRWHTPHEAYLALADAIYRPRVTLTESPPPDETYSTKDNQCALKISLPFFLPGKSDLLVEFEEKADKIGVILMKPHPEGLKVGPGEYELIRKYPFHQTTTCTAKVRLDLFGKGEMQLPHEPLFCGADIETQIDKNTSKGVQPPTEIKWIVVKKIVGGRTLRATPGDVISIMLKDLKNAVIGGNRPKATDKP